MLFFVRLKRFPMPKLDAFEDVGGSTASPGVPINLFGVLNNFSFNFWENKQ